MSETPDPTRLRRFNIEGESIELTVWRHGDYVRYVDVVNLVADLQAENARLTAALNQVNGCRMQPCPQCREFIAAALTPKGETP